MASRFRAAEAGPLGAPGSGWAPTLVQEHAAGRHGARKLACRFRGAAAGLSRFDFGRLAGLTWALGSAGTLGAALAGALGRNKSRLVSRLPERREPLPCPGLCSATGDRAAAGAWSVAGTHR